MGDWPNYVRTLYRVGKGGEEGGLKGCLDTTNATRYSPVKTSSNRFCICKTCKDAIMNPMEYFNGMLVGSRVERNADRSRYGKSAIPEYHIAGMVTIGISNRFQRRQVY